MTSTHTDSSSARSAPPSPATTMTSSQNETAHHPTVDNSLDDIFGSSPPPESRREAPERHAETHAAPEPSEFPSLRRQHVTAGYRDGVATSKGEHVQEGFDAGFPIGARLGMRAGTIIGILEGIIRGLEDRSGSGVVKKPVSARSTAASTVRGDDSQSAESAESRRNTREQVLRIYQDAIKALDVQSVFTGLDAGAGAQGETGLGEDVNKAKAGERAETQLGRKGDAVVSRWEQRVAVPRWEENMETLETEESQGDKGAAGERS